MEYLIKSAKIIAPSSSYHLKTRDLLIKNGKISKIAESIVNEKAKVMEFEDLHLSIGWIDLHANIQDPGFEHKEDLTSAIDAAAAGGFTTIAVSPLSSPIRDSKSQIEYLTKNLKNSAVTVLPYGAVSKNAEGKELAELHDMKCSGAIAFFDGKRSIENPNLLNRALHYAQGFDGLIVNYPHTKELAYKGVMNEGITSTQLGLKGIPELAETLMVARDLNILRYSGGRLHFNCISSEESIKLIAKAKKDKLNVTCDVASYNLLLDDSELTSFDSRLKTLPPLRSKSTIRQLIKGIKSGAINAICSDHLPEDVEEKKKEIDHAAFGMINLQTSFSLANTALRSELDITAIIQLFTLGPSQVLQLENSKIEVGEMANLTLFSPQKKFIFSKKEVKSKSLNSPIFGKELKGKVYGILNNGKLKMN